MRIIKRKKIKKRKIDVNSFDTTKTIAVSFLSAILIGTLLLLLPWATAAGERTSILTALFTSTTSVCITGLVVVDTFSHWTLFGQIIILILIQIGGIGVVCISAIMIVLLGRGLSLKARVLMRDSFNLDSTKGVVRFCQRVVAAIFVVEAIGAVLSAFVFVPIYGLKGLYYAVFHSISAFCNAGIDVIGSDSLCSFNQNAMLLGITMFLIVLGGLGFVVWFDIIKFVKNYYLRKRDSTVVVRLNEHTRLVLCLTASFILAGTVLTFLGEYSNPETIGQMSFKGKILNSLFQSVTYRTAGFAAVPQDKLRESTSLIGLMFMFVGGSPVGTAGGVKTVTFFALILYGISSMKSNIKPVVFNRSFSFETIHRALAIIIISFMTTMVLSILLMFADEDISTIDALYETFSATGTVGLSRNLTSSLNCAGRIIIIIGMYLGRIGPISLVMLFRRKKKPNEVLKYAEGKFYIG